MMNLMKLIAGGVLSLCVAGAGAAPTNAELKKQVADTERAASGTLALSSGPVYDPAGKLISRFSSIWRQEALGQWRVVFDRGSEVCDCMKP